MTDKQARAVALRDITVILGVASYNGGSGLCPSFEANKFFSEGEKKKIRRQYESILFGLGKRLDKAESWIDE